MDGQRVPYLEELTVVERSGRDHYIFENADGDRFHRSLFGLLPTPREAWQQVKAIAEARIATAAQQIEDAQAERTTMEAALAVVADVLAALPQEVADEGRP